MTFGEARAGTILQSGDEFLVFTRKRVYVYERCERFISASFDDKKFSSYGWKAYNIPGELV